MATGISIMKTTQGIVLLAAIKCQSAGDKTQPPAIVATVSKPLLLELREQVQKSDCAQSIRL